MADRLDLECDIHCIVIPDVRFDAKVEGIQKLKPSGACPAEL